jgi:hypothetical protein
VLDGGRWLPISHFGKINFLPIPDHRRFEVGRKITPRVTELIEVGGEALDRISPMDISCLLWFRLAERTAGEG